jgi:hypothetical protein
MHPYDGAALVWRTLTRADRVARAARWLLVALLLVAAINTAIVLTMRARGESWHEAKRAAGLVLSRQLTGPTGVDSWRSMTAAYRHFHEKPDELYWVFLKKGVKFQYPPSSLLVMPLLPLPLGADFHRKMGFPSSLAVCFTILCSAWLALKLLARTPERKIAWRDPLVICCAVLIGVLGCTYYPLTRGHNLGQIQVYLGAFVALSLLLNAYAWRGLSGACIGLCCLVKPQYGLIILWGFLRRDRRFVIGALLVFAAGLALSLHTFGLHNHLQYLEVLKRLSVGEAYGPNQTANGLLHRCLKNGSAIKFQFRRLPPHNDVVYVGTLVSSLVIILLGLFMPAAQQAKGRSTDLALAVCAATMASPIAWEHHYGAFFPVFAIALPVALAAGRAGSLLLISYLLVANELLRPKLIYASRWSGLLGSHLFYGALLLFGLLLWGRLRNAGQGLERDGKVSMPTALPASSSASK